MALTKVLVTIKTYPSLSEKYDELVCTAGFLEDGSMIRIYPVPFRKLDYERQYKKYQWIEIDLEKRSSDFRPESYKPVDIDKAFTISEFIDANRWDDRRQITVYKNMTELITKAKDEKNRTSLAVLKPKEIINFIWEPVSREWNPTILEKIRARAAQGDLFGEKGENPFEVVKKLPYKFSYVFTTEDDKERTLMIEDWELGALYWKCLESANGDEKTACQKVKEKYFDYMAKKRDLYFYLGTTLKHHNVGPNPFIIIGAFYPPKPTPKQLKLEF